MSQSLYTIDHEKQFLSAIIRNPSVLAEVPQITEKDFSPTNRVVFSAIKSGYASAAHFNKFLLIERLNALSIKIGDVIEPAIYINSLELLNVSDKSAVGIAKEIKRTTIRRELNNIGKNIIKLTEKEENKKASELLAGATEIFHDHVNMLGDGNDEPKDLYGTMDVFLDNESNFDTKSVATPYPIYNDMYGFCDPGNIYVIAARNKVGKSTWVMSMLDQMMKQDDNFTALMLDTELTVEEVQSRLISSMTGIKEFHIRRKNYKKNKEMNEKVEAARATIKPFFNRISHQFIGGMDLEQQLSIARRWIYKNVIVQKKKCIIIYDYFKLNSSAEFSGQVSRDIVIGKKVDAYKNLAKDMQVPIWALVQANRENEDTQTGKKITNGNVIAGSDMISSFCTNIYLLQKLTPEEKVFLNQLSEKDATHSLTAIYTRQLGPDDFRQSRIVKYKDEKGKERYIENYLLYSFNNFKVTEKGTFKDIVDKGQTLSGNIQTSSSSTLEVL